jgi:hypothetical protein
VARLTQALGNLIFYSINLRRLNRFFFKEFLIMSNAQVRLLASAIALLAGGIIANTSNIVTIQV